MAKPTPIDDEPKLRWWVGHDGFVHFNVRSIMAEPFTDAEIAAMRQEVVDIAMLGSWEVN